VKKIIKPSSVRGVNYASSPLLASKTPSGRSRLLVALVGLGFAGLLGRAAWIQLINADYYQRQGEQRYAHRLPTHASRGSILDRNGQMLATSVPTPSIYAVPKEYKATPEQQRALNKLLGVSQQEFAQRLAGGSSNFAWIRRQVDQATGEQIAQLGIKGLGQDREYRRRYPEGESAAHVVGFTNLDDIGQEGIELSFQKQLQGQKGTRGVVKDRLGRVIDDLGLET